MTRTHEYAHGPTRREQQIIDLAEQGLRADQIAAVLGLKENYVRDRIAALVNPKLEDWQSPAVSGSKALLAALRRHFPERCGSAK